MCVTAIALQRPLVDVPHAAQAGVGNEIRHVGGLLGCGVLVEGVELSTADELPLVVGVLQVGLLLGHVQRVVVVHATVGVSVGVVAQCEVVAVEDHDVVDVVLALHG